MTRQKTILESALDYNGENAYGRLSIPGVRTLAGPRKLKRCQWANNNFLHRAKNGVYDPISYYHVLDEIMQLTPYQDFRTVDLIYRLDETKPQLIWDAVSVGRILTDIVENLHDAYDAWPIAMGRRWNGMTYAVSGLPESRVMLHRLHDDLYALCEETLKEESRGVFTKRTASPLNRCPSVMPL